MQTIKPKSEGATMWKAVEIIFGIALVTPEIVAKANSKPPTKYIHSRFHMVVPHIHIFLL